MKETTKIVLNKWPELKYLVQDCLNEYLFFFELFFFLIILKPEKPLYCLIKMVLENKKILIKSLMQLLLLCLGKKRRILKLNISYSNNQKTSGIERRHYSNTQAFCYKANIFTSNLAKHYLVKWVHLHCSIDISNVHWTSPNFKSHLPISEFSGYHCKNSLNT